MKDFANIPNTTGSFPNVTASDASDPALRNGTPLKADLMTDIFGMVQAILNSAGVTPSGSAESTSASDVLTGIQRVAGHPGEVVYWAGEVAPDARLVQLAGQTITAANYPDLVTATYVGDGNNSDSDYSAFYKCSDAGGTTRDIAGPYFKLPDCRGYFVRGLDDGSGNDVGRDFDGGESINGGLQDEAYGSHKHNIRMTSTYSYNKVTRLETAQAGYSDPLLYFQTTLGGVSGLAATSQQFVLREDSGASQSDIETATPQELLDIGDGEVRPTNIAFRVMIRY